MKRFRILTIIIIVMLVVQLMGLLAQNPLFLNDISRAMGDLKLELTITFLLVIILFWSGMEVNHRAKRIQKDNTNPDKLYQANFLQGISTELIGAFITTILLGMLVLIFDQYQAIQSRKDELILQMGSSDNGFAVEAARQLNSLHWLSDGTTEGIHLEAANLQGAYLVSANLRDANLTLANLRGALLQLADLQDASLYFANMEGAVIWEGDTNLTGAILPDGTTWTPDTDMGRYTDRNHANFWDPCTAEAAVIRPHC